MQRSTSLLIRSRGIFSIFNKGQQAQDAQKMSKVEQEKLREILPSLRTDAPRATESRSLAEYADEVPDQRIDMDAIRARGVMKYRYNYSPPADVSNMIVSEISSLPEFAGKSSATIMEFSLNDNSLKSKVILAIGSKLKHYPTNSSLHYLKTVADVVEFYKEPIQNLNAYSKLARSENKPTNVHVVEQPARFHPDDKEAWHGGVTAFPGTGGKVFGLRNKRIYRQFQPKEHWYDYEDRNFDYTRPDKNMPWDTEIAQKMDKYPDRRFNISTKTFTRTK